MQNLVLKIAVLMGVIGGSCVVVWKAHESLNSVVSSQMSADKFVAFDEKVGSTASATPDKAKAAVENDLQPTVAELEPTLAAAPPASTSLMSSRSLSSETNVDGRSSGMASESSAVPNFFSAAGEERTAAPLNSESPEPEDSKLMAAGGVAPAQSEVTGASAETSELAPTGQDPFNSLSALSSASKPTSQGMDDNRRFPALPEPEPLPANVASRAAPLMADSDPAPTTGANEVDPFAVLGLNAPQPSKLPAQAAEPEATPTPDPLDAPGSMSLGATAPSQAEEPASIDLSAEKAAEIPAAKQGLEVESPSLMTLNAPSAGVPESDPFSSMPTREPAAPQVAPAQSLEGGVLEPALSMEERKSGPALAEQNESSATLSPASPLSTMERTEDPLAAAAVASTGAPTRSAPKMPSQLELPSASSATEAEEGALNSFRANDSAMSRSRVMQADSIENAEAGAVREILPTAASESLSEPAPFLAIRPQAETPAQVPAKLPLDVPARSVPQSPSDWAKDVPVSNSPAALGATPSTSGEGEALSRSRVTWSESVTIKEETRTESVQSRAMQSQSNSAASGDLLALQAEMEPLTRERPPLPPTAPTLSTRMTQEVLPQREEAVPESLFAPELPAASKAESSRTMLASAEVEEVLPELPPVSPTPAAQPKAIPETPAIPPATPMTSPMTPPAVPALPATPPAVPALPVTPPAVPALPTTPAASPPVTPIPLPMTTAPALDNKVAPAQIPAPALPTLDPAPPTPAAAPTLNPTEAPQAMPVRSPFPPDSLPQTPALDLAKPLNTQIVAAAPAGPQTAEMKIERSAPPEAVVGEPVIYSILIRNIGSADAKDVVVEDRVPKGTQLEGTIPQAYLNDGKLSWQLGTVKAGEERKIQLKVIPLESGQIGSVATVSFAASAPAKMQVQAPELAITMSGPSEATLGEHATFQFKLMNRGKGAAKSVFLRAVLPQGIRHPGGNDLEYEAGTLEPGSERVINLSVTPEIVGAFSIVAQISNENKTAGEARADLRVIQSRLELTRTGPENRFVGRPASFTTRVTNHSTQTLNNVTIQEKLPEDVELAAVPRSGRWDAKTRLVTWTIPTIEAGQSLELNSLYVANRGGIHEGKLVAVDEFGNRTEITTSMNAKGFAELKTDVNATHRTVLVGERVSYRLTLKNVGTDTAFEVRPRFLFPEGFEFANASGPTKYEVSGQMVEFQPLSELAPTGERLFELSLIANAPGTSKVTVQLLTSELGEPLQIDQPVRVVSNNP